MIGEILDGGTPNEIVATFIALALIAALFLCLLFIIVGGITFILSAGNEEKIKKAVHTIRFAIIGLVVTFLAFFAVKLLSNLLNIPFELGFPTIIDLMREIGTALSSTAS